MICMDTNITIKMPNLNAKSWILSNLVYFEFKSRLSVVFEKPYNILTKLMNLTCQYNTINTLIPLLPKDSISFSSGWEEVRPDWHCISYLKYEQSHIPRSKLQEIDFLWYLFGHNPKMRLSSQLLTRIIT